MTNETKSTSKSTPAQHPRLGRGALAAGALGILGIVAVVVFVIRGGGSGSDARAGTHPSEGGVAASP